MLGEQHFDDMREVAGEKGGKKCISKKVGA